MIQWPQLLKIVFAGATAAVMGIGIPSMFRTPVPASSIQSTIPERMATNEARIALLEHRVEIIENAKIGEQLAEIKARQQLVIALFVPMSLFIFTHTFEIIQRIRGKQRTRADDVEPDKRKISERGHR